MRRAYIMRPRIADANHYIYKNHTNNIYDHLHTTPRTHRKRIDYSLYIINIIHNKYK
mgnify:CR=1 FL=1